MTKPRMIAHRGFADQYPENTVRAMGRSVRRVDMVEVDVRRCGTGELVAFHDEDLDRVTGASGRIDETSLAALRELTVDGSEEPIATLPELLATVPASVRVNLELKEREVAADAISVCETHDVDAVYSSFHEGAIEEVRDRRPDAPVAVLCHDAQAVLDRLALAAELDAVAFHPSLELVDGWTGPDAATIAEVLDVTTAAVDRGDGPPGGTEGHLATKGNDLSTKASDFLTRVDESSTETNESSTGTDVVSLARLLGLRVNVWTANSPADVDRLRRRGVDGVMVDHAELVPPTP